MNIVTSRLVNCNALVLPKRTLVANKIYVKTRLDNQLPQDADMLIEQKEEKTPVARLALKTAKIVEEHGKPKKKKSR